MLAYPATNQSFLETIFGAQWPRAHVCAFYGNPSDPHLPRGHWWGGPAADLLPGFRPDQNTYFSLSLFKGSRRLLSEWEALYLLGVDDVGTKVLAGDVENVLGRPDYRLETSQGNEQWGYLLDPRVTHGDGAAALQDQLKRLLVGEEPDPGMQNLNRYFRLPYGANGKPSARKFRCRMRAWLGADNDALDGGLACP